MLHKQNAVNKVHSTEIYLNQNIFVLCTFLWPCIIFLPKILQILDYLKTYCKFY